MSMSNRNLGKTPDSNGPQGGLGIDDLLADHEKRYGDSPGRIMSAAKSGVHVVETRSSIQSFYAPSCDFHRINFQLTGRITVAEFSLNRRTNSRPGHLVTGGFGFIPSGTGVKVHIDGDPFHVLQVMIPRTLMQRSLDTLTGKPEAEETMLGHVGSAGPNLVRISELLKHEYTQPTPGSAVMLDSIAEMLCIELSRNFTGQSKSSAKHGAFSQDELLRIGDLMEEAVCGEMGIGDIAEALDISPCKLSRSFKNHFSETPREQLLRLRLERAREILATKYTPLVEVALLCGFSSQSHMTTAFTNHFGISPARYRSEAFMS